MNPMQIKELSSFTATLPPELPAWKWTIIKLWTYSDASLLCKSHYNQTFSKLQSYANCYHWLHWIQKFKSQMWVLNYSVRIINEKRQFIERPISVLRIWLIFKIQQNVVPNKILRSIKNAARHGCLKLLLVKLIGITKGRHEYTELNLKNLSQDSSIGSASAWYLGGLKVKSLQGLELFNDNKKNILFEFEYKYIIHIYCTPPMLQILDFGRSDQKCHHRFDNCIIRPRQCRS